jgi:hypothetical protein
MTTRRLMIALLGLGFALFVTPRIALAASQHLEQAIAETQKAIHEGKEAHHASSLVQHSDNAIDHAMQALKEQPNSHIKSGIRHLRKAIKVAKGTHSARRLTAGVKHAEKALSEFNAAK